ncbi:MAG: protein translocase subunit SecD [Candidatus Melainabacteria bacterium]|jgi:preprotein translocase subunit SecD|nr:protein translocase subunit SecD [Candidatus Melainabacteria bacterium]
MQFIKDNLRIILVIAVTIFAFKGLVLIDRTSTEPNYDKLKQQLVYSKPNFHVFTKLKLGLDLIGGSQFEFQARTTPQVPVITPDVMRGLVKVFENRVNASGTTEAVVQQVGKNRILVEVPGADPAAVKRRLLKTANLEFKELKSGTDEEQLWVGTGITGADLKRASVSTDGVGSWAIDFELKPQAAKAFGDLTSRLINKPLGISLDGNIISSPNVRSAITAGSGQITGNFTVEEAQDLAVQLNAGALPVPVKILQERSIGATLGQESIEKSFTAGLWGFLAVMLFMILVYRLPGLVAAVSLSIYVLLAFYVYQDNVTLTLAGLAGFILSIGMAVDANILIFERTKEEMSQGKSVFIGLRDGFDRAYTSIFDSNMNTSMVCLILIIFGTGIVKGFAITLLIGVLLSLVSSLFITKTLIFTIVKTFNIKETALFR